MTLLLILLLTLLGILPGGAQDGSPAEVDPPPGGEFYGISPQADLADEDYERMARGGVGTLRITLGWPAVQAVEGDCLPEPTVNACNWTEIDAVVAAAAANGIRVMPVLGGIAEFTREATSGPTGTKREHPPIEGPAFDAWQRFLTAAAARYGHRGTFWKGFREFTGLDPLPIENWQVWNEPNAASYWPPQPKASEYATLVAGSSKALKSGDPRARVVLGGLFGTTTVSSSKYLDRFYRAEGIEDHFEAIAIHPYSPTLRGIKAQARWARHAARRAGDPEVGLWVTELGWGSADGGHELNRGLEGQARMLSRAFRLLLRKRGSWNVEGAVWFTWQDRQDRAVCRFCRHAGLLDGEGQPKPAWEAFKRAAGAGP
jgi:hypothetical protein